jgi:hypothetical protein
MKREIFSGSHDDGADDHDAYVVDVDAGTVVIYIDTASMIPDDVYLSDKENS